MTGLLLVFVGTFAVSVTVRFCADALRRREREAYKQGAQDMKAQMLRAQAEAAQRIAQHGALLWQHRENIARAARNN